MAAELRDYPQGIAEDMTRQAINDLLRLGDPESISPGPITTEGHTAIPNYLLTDNRLPDSTIRIYGTLVNLARPSEDTPSLAPAKVAITLAITLEAPGTFAFRNRRAREVRMPKAGGGKLTREWDVGRLPAGNGPATSEGETNIPNAVLTDTRLSSRDVRVYGVLKAHQDPESGMTLVPQALILWILSSASERSVQNSITALAKAGYIAKLEHGRYNLPPLYRLAKN